jgi:hypothetical protein
MSDEGFLRRWSRLKAAPETAEPPAVPAAQPAQAVQPEHAGQAGQESAAAASPRAEPETAAAPPLPTLADAAMLTADSDYSAFVARGVDPDVRRLAMKKLFADPHFNRIDGLDIYMSDYNIPSPVSPEMLASLSHARSVFGRIDELLDPIAADEAAPLTVAAASAADTTDTTDTTDMTNTADTPAPAPHAAPPPDQDAA